MKLKIVITTLFMLIRPFNYVIAQIQTINTSTNESLTTISKFGDDIMVGSNKEYLVKFSNDFTSMSYVNTPSINPSDWREYHRIDSNHIYFYQQEGNYTFVYSTSNEGNTWHERLNTDTVIGEGLVMFDSLEGIIMCFNFIAMHTYDGGQTWVKESQPLYYTNALTSFGDSTICAGTQDGFVISNNRGHTWSYVSTSYLNSGLQYSFYFLSKDTIFSVSNSPTGLAYLSYSDSSGLSWTHHLFPLTSSFMAYGVAFLNKNEGYVVGTSSNFTIKGIIYKTLDGGVSWERYDTGLPVGLSRINFLNDSIALITGTKGTLIKWNKYSLATEVINLEKEKMSTNIFPNPAHDKVNIKYSNSKIRKVQLFNELGQEILNTYDNEIDVSKFSKGVYYIKFENVVKKLIVQ